MAGGKFTGRTAALVGGSALVGGVVLAVLTTLAPETPSGGRAGIEAREFDESLRPERVEGDPVFVGGGAAPDRAIHNVISAPGIIEVPGDDGRVAQRYEYRRVHPQPNGWSRLEFPTATVYLSDTRMLRVRADEGLILMPDQTPKSGDLRGSVRIALIEADDVYAPDFDPDAHEPTLVIETEAIGFDATMYEFSTEERIVAMTARAAIAGRGLSLIYDDQAERIEHLSLAQREYILYRPDAPDERAGDAAASTAERRADGARRNAPHADDEPRDETPPTYYRIELTGGVVVEHGFGPQGVSATASSLTVEMAMRAGALDASLAWRPIGASPDLHATTRSAHASIGPAGALWWTAAMAAVDEPADRPRLLGDDGSLGESDLLITGDGPLRIRPLPDRPRELNGPDDARLVMDGTPVTLESADGRALCRRLEYQSAVRRVTLHPGEREPVRVLLNDLGEAMLPSALHVHTETGLCQSTGAGRFLGARPATAKEPPARAGMDDLARSLPPGFSINWTRGVELTFEAADPAQAFERIRSAVFRGDVRVDDPGGFTLLADEQRAEFQADPISRESRLATVTATGSVRVQSPEGEARAGELVVAFEPGPDGDPLARTALLTGDVMATDREQTLHAARLRVELTTPAEGEDVEDDFDAAVRFVEADGDVRVELADGVRAFADRLEADPREETAVLTGEQVVLWHEGTQVLGRRIELSQRERRLTVPGAGTLVYLQPAEDGNAPAPHHDRPEDLLREIERRLEEAGAGGASETRPSEWNAPVDPTPDPADDDPTITQGPPPGDDASAVRVRWNGSAVFDYGPGVATFNDAVFVESSPRPLEYDTLAADRLIVELITVSAPAEGDEYDEASAVRRLRKMTAIATGERLAEIQSRRFENQSRSLETLLVSIGAPVLEYDDLIEQLAAIGPGRMLVVDRREPDAPTDEAALATDRADPVAALSGPGETLFRWDGRMLLRSARGEMVVEDHVSVRHRSLGAEIPTLLTCQTLTAGIDSGVGFDLLNPGAPDRGVRLARATAEDGIFLDTGKEEIDADSLRYDRRTELATIEGTPARPVTLVRKGSAVPIRAQRAVWDLYTGNLRVEGGQPVVVPLERTGG